MPDGKGSTKNYILEWKSELLVDRPDHDSHANRTERYLV